MELGEAKSLIEGAVSRRELLIVVGSCYVEYWGRAASKLPRGNRVLMVKGDGSFAIHQNKKLNAVNYMIGASVNCALEEGHLMVIARKSKPKETMNVRFHSIDFVQSFDIEGKDDLSLFGSEKEISDQLGQDLSFIEEGLKPVHREEQFRKGIIDLLAEDKDGNLVVIEVKRRQAGYDAVEQLNRYMKQVERMKGKKTRGMLIAPEIGKNAYELLERYGLEFAKIDLEMGNPKAKIKGIQKKQKTIDEFFQS